MINKIYKGDYMQEELIINSSGKTRKLLYMEQNNNSNIKYIEEKELGKKYRKGYIISGQESFVIYGYTDNINCKQLSFSFKPDHPLYPSLYMLLKDDDSLVINDFYSKEDSRYVTLSKANNMIKLKFINKINSQDYRERFCINIFNNDLVINSIPSRLNSFLDNVKDDLFGDYHQITIDEYMSRTRTINKSNNKYKN